MDIKEAIDYNNRQRAAGKLTDEQVAKLVALMQEYAPEELVRQILPTGKQFQVDGMFGPMTAAVLEHVFEKMPAGVTATEPPLVAAPQSFAQALIQVARSQLGRGEEQFDNSGRAINEYRDLPDPARVRDLGSWANWCEFFLNWCVRQAYTQLGRPDDGKFGMFSDAKYGGKLMPIGGAKDFTYRAATSKHGKFIARRGKILEKIQPADIFSIQRGGSTAERTGPGHIGLIESVRSGSTVVTLEGNTGKFPSVVRRMERDLAKLPLNIIARLS